MKRISLALLMTTALAIAWPLAAKGAPTHSVDPDSSFTLLSVRGLTPLEARARLEPILPPGLSLQVFDGKLLARGSPRALQQARRLIETIEPALSLVIHTRAITESQTQVREGKTGIVRGPTGYLRVRARVRDSKALVEWISADPLHPGRQRLLIPVGEWSKASPNCQKAVCKFEINVQIQGPGSG